jgi:hypothetical protein
MRRRAGTDRFNPVNERIAVALRHQSPSPAGAAVRWSRAAAGAEDHRARPALDVAAYGSVRRLLRIWSGLIQFSLSQ